MPTTNKKNQEPEMPPQSGDEPKGSERNPPKPQDSLPAGQGGKHLTEEDVRRIARQEAKGIWRHDANHGATQERIRSQLSRDEEAGLDYKEPQPEDPDPRPESRARK